MRLAAGALDRVHATWRALDGWRNTAVDLAASPWLAQWEYVEMIVEMAEDMSTAAERIEAEEAKVSRLLWDMVIMLSDPKWIHRIVEEADETFFSFLTW